MRQGSVGAALLAALAIATTPLACGDDEKLPGDDSGASGAGASATGGGGGMAGQTDGGLGGGGDTARGGDTASGGTPGPGGSAGTSGGPTGGANGGGGESGSAGATDGGMSGGPVGGEGGEGGEPWIDEATERLKRICEKTRPLNCEDYSTCLDIFRWAFFGGPHCGPVADAMLSCLDTQATIEDFACLYGKPFVIERDYGPCGPYFTMVGNAYCFARVIE